MWMQGYQAWPYSLHQTLLLCKIPEVLPILFRNSQNTKKMETNTLNVINEHSIVLWSPNILPFVPIIVPIILLFIRCPILFQSFPILIVYRIPLSCPKITENLWEIPRNHEETIGFAWLPMAFFGARKSQKIHGRWRPAHSPAWAWWVWVVEVAAWPPARPTLIISNRLWKAWNPLNIILKYHLFHNLPWHFLIHQKFEIRDDPWVCCDVSV